MAKKVADLCVKVGEYNGKGVWENIGAVLETDKGEMILLKRTFNPAGVPNPENRDTVMVSRFALKDKGDSGQGGKGQSYQEPVFGDDESSSIPF